MAVRWFDDQYDLNHANALPLMPTEFSSLKQYHIKSIQNNVVIDSVENSANIQEH